MWKVYILNLERIKRMNLQQQNTDQLIKTQKRTNHKEKWWYIENLKIFKQNTYYKHSKSASHKLANLQLKPKKIECWQQNGKVGSSKL